MEKYLPAVQWSLWKAAIASVTVHVTVVKYPDTSDLRKKGLILAQHDSPSWWRQQQEHDPQEGEGGCSCSAHFLLFLLLNGIFINS